MRILIISFFFPPYNTIGAVRLGETAAHLIGSGHDVRVISACDQGPDRSLQCPIAEERVTRTYWLGPRPSRRSRDVLKESAESRAQPRTPGLVQATRAFAKRAFLVPDPEVGWIPFATLAGLRISRRWKPNVIFASAPPFSSLIAARAIAGRTRIPWVAELRDLWTHTAYRAYGPVRSLLERALERHTLGSAAGIVTVTEPWAKALGERFGRPVLTVMNGFDPRPQPSFLSEAESECLTPEHLHLAHFGSIYGGRRNPTLLFKSVHALGDRRSRIRVHFFGPELDIVMRLAEQEGITEQIKLHGPVPHSLARTLQTRMDALVLLLWDNPDELGVIPGKMFEYIGTGRPILTFGCENGAAAALVRESGLGWAISDVEEGRTRLSTLLQRKLSGLKPTVPPEMSAGFERSHQVRKLAAMLNECSR